MPKAIKTIQISERTLEEAAEWYKVHRVPKAFSGLHPMLLDYVRRASGGDWRRCVKDKDGSVTIYNNPVWQRTK